MSKLYFSFRPSAKELLDNSFFLEDYGVVEVMNREEAVTSELEQVTLRYVSLLLFDWICYKLPNVGTS